MPTKPYCGYKRKPPTNHHLGSLAECVKLHQLRRFGRIRAKKRDVKRIQSLGKSSPLDKMKLLGTINGKKYRLNSLIMYPVGKGKKADIEREIKQLQKELPPLELKYMEKYGTSDQIINYVKNKLNQTSKVLQSHIKPKQLSTSDELINMVNTKFKQAKRGIRKYTLPTASAVKTHTRVERNLPKSVKRNITSAVNKMTSYEVDDMIKAMNEKIRSK